MAVLQQAGRIALAKAVAAQTIHIAWGRGLPAWDAAPEPEPITANALVDEIGRRLVTEVRFARPDDNGEIELPSGARYSVSDTPTTFVYLRAAFGFGSLLPLSDRLDHHQHVRHAKSQQRTPQRVKS